MTTFRNGPCASTRLHLRRTPVFLRVVDKDGTFKALTGHDDKPKEGDVVHLYRLAQPGAEYRMAPEDDGKKAPRGWFVSGEYELWEGEQPPEEALRGVIAWRQWCIAVNPGNPHA